MNLPRFLSYLFALAVSGGAAAFQVGQLKATSRLGEPLAARIVLHGAGTDDFEKLETLVLPDVGLTAADPAHRVVASITTGYARDTFGQAYVTLRTSAPVHEPALSFRVRIGHDGRAVVAHFTLALAPPVSPPVQARSRVAPPIVSRQARPVAIPRAADAVVATGATYGPVRPGDSLWRILRAQGLSTDATIIARIVHDNPHAFIAGDASRLRVGVELILPNRPARTPTSETRRTPSAPGAAPDAEATLRSAAPTADTRPAASLHATAHAQPAERPGADAAAPAAGNAGTRSTTAPGLPAPAVATRPAPVAADTAARLEALSARFATIRARYAEPGKPAPRPRIATTATTDSAAGTPGATITRSAPAVTAPARGRHAVLLTGTALVALCALGAGMTMTLRRRQQRRLYQMARSADLERVAEISRKTEKRLLLEDSMRRNLHANGTGSASENNDGAVLREVDHRIAHGQYAAARALLENVIAATPGNFHAKLRLAEIHYLDENARAFTALADELLREHRADIGDEGWQRVLRMGRVLTPDRPPFSGPVAITHRRA